MAENQFVTCLDLGSYYIKASAITGKNGDIIFSVYGDSEGITNGKITDSVRLVSQLKHIIRKLEIKTGVPTEEVILNVDLGNIRYESNRGSTGLSKGRVYEDDVLRAIKNSMIVAKGPKEEIVDLLISDYKVDGVSLTNPEGAEGNILDVNSQVLIAKKELIDSASDLLESEGLRIAGTGVSVHGMANLMLSKAQRFSGAVLIDSGHVKTDIAIIKNNKIVHMESIPLGGRSITKDLSVVLKISMDEAESLKKKFASGLVEKSHINYELIKGVIVARIREILQFCENLLKEHPEYKDVSTAIVYGGGLCSFPEIEKYGKDILSVSTNYITSDIIKSDDIYTFNATGCAFNMIHEIQSEFILEKYEKYPDEYDETEFESEHEGYFSVFDKARNKAKKSFKDLMDDDFDQEENPPSYKRASGLNENDDEEENKENKITWKLKKFFGIE